MFNADNKMMRFKTNLFSMVIIFGLNLLWLFEIYRGPYKILTALFTLITLIWLFVFADIECFSKDYKPMAMMPYGDLIWKITKMSWAFGLLIGVVLAWHFRAFNTGFLEYFYSITIMAITFFLIYIAANKEYAASENTSDKSAQ